MKRIVIKVGSNVLTRENGTLDITRVSSLADQIQALRQNGIEVILVTSGAVACGRSLTKAAPALDEVQQRQLYAAVGQVRLMDQYYRLFADYGIAVGQILTMKKNFEGGEEYDNQRGCMEGMLESGVLPIVNENDAVSITELMFTDNDELSGLVATMMGADTLVILSNIDGLYDGDPADPESRVVARIEPEDDLSSCIGAKRSSAGRGGMQTKYKVAKQLAGSGVRVILANGRRDGILVSLATNPQEAVHTEFIPTKK
ncbi:MAG: glutamate 5-kinase [Bacteroidales bacterium]|nr:glutamate 5-kinase [Bacteroidales bacterium]